MCLVVAARCRRRVLAGASASVAQDAAFVARPAQAGFAPVLAVSGASSSALAPIASPTRSERPSAARTLSCAGPFVNKGSPVPALAMTFLSLTLRSLKGRLGRSSSGTPMLYRTAATWPHLGNSPTPRRVTRNSVARPDLAEATGGSGVCAPPRGHGRARCGCVASVGERMVRALRLPAPACTAQVRASTVTAPGRRAARPRRSGAGVPQRGPGSFSAPCRRSALSGLFAASLR